MYKKEDNIFVELEDCYLMKVQYKTIWYDSYIDKSDYEDVKQKHWRTSHKGNKIYLVSGSKAKNNVVYLHNMVMNYTYITGFEVDHIDGNSLNNRKNNLRIVTRQENIENSSVRIDSKLGIRGICKTRNDKYKVDFQHRKDRFYFKDWNTIEEAVYCRKIVEEYFGLEILKRNPLAQKYLTLTEEKKKEVENIVIEILRKQR